MQPNNPLIAALQDPTLYPHPVSGFKVMETHISWVILTGPYAYKIKKPVNFGFLDFTTLEKRLHYCELEIQYNQPLAGKLYIKMLPITGTPTQPNLNGKGDTIEYAVQMKQFPAGVLFSQLADAGKLPTDLMVPLAKQMGHFHRHQPADCHNDFGSLKAVIEPIHANFETLAQLLPKAQYQSDVAPLEDWVQAAFKKCHDLIESRKVNGFVKACHGDLHCGNIALYDDQPLVFDCIEFNENFRWIDTMSDVGFLTMDLIHRDLMTHRALFLNTYLDTLFDYTGLPLLDFYQHYRAMVRAKVALLTAQQVDKNTAAYQDCLREYEKHIQLGLSLSAPKTPTLTVTVGPAGSGKTLYTSHQMAKNQAIRLRSDVFRKHLFDLDPHDTSLHTIRPALYAEQTTQRVYQHLRDTAKDLLTAGFSVIIDATCLKKWQRDHFFDLAKQQQVPFKIWTFELSEAEMMENIAHRQLRGDLTSDATVEILKAQLKEKEPLSETEKQVAETISQDIIQGLMNKS